MTSRLNQDLDRKIAARLRYYDDLGIRLFYKDRTANPTVFLEAAPQAAVIAATASASQSPAEASAAVGFNPPPSVSMRPVAPSGAWSLRPASPSAAAPTPAFAPRPAAPSLFDSVNKPSDDTLLKVREDLGDCKRCKLHKHRKNIVFADGNPKADLVFVGEGPGADEDAQGLPFVGRAGKLLTQMIEAMGLRRQDVYICNVVKCRPPENRLPEKDEIAECSPFLF